MILTCPQCSSRYLLSAHALAPEGRKVKCSACGEVWHQQPDRDELKPMSPPGEAGGQPFSGSFKDNLERIEIEFRDIPESVKPLRDPATPPALASAHRLQQKPRLAGYAASVVVMAGLALFMASARQTIVDRWLPAAAIFNAVGLSVAIPGEGIMFDTLSVTAQSPSGSASQAQEKNKAEELLIEGRLINVSSRAQMIPHLLADLRDADGLVIARVPIESSQSLIETGQALDFKTTIKNPAQSADGNTFQPSEVKIYLSLLPATGH